jgi:hypothetical protein
MFNTTRTLTDEEIKEVLNRIETKQVIKYGTITSGGILLGGAVKFYSPIVDGLFIGTISSIKNYLTTPFFADPLIGVLPNWVVVLLVLSVITMKLLDIKIEQDNNLGEEFMSIKKSRKENMKRVLGGRP